tara:strand:- start:779 stop:1204 length:426 start_codon:yes stop_codon:yes gene_type:complete
MAKVSRSVLKEIVKECLVEILSEGLSQTTTINERKSKRRNNKKNSSIPPEVFQKRNKMLSEKTSKRDPVNVSTITDDPLMQDILADTAATTFRDQPLTESKGKSDYVPGDAAAKVVYESELEDLFEGAGNWAALAFSSDKN